jgi:protoporphyrinogen oxidase
MADIRSLLGDDLLTRPRHGRIHLRKRWIHFPLKPIDLLVHLDRAFAAGTLRDMLFKSKAPANGEESFASVLRANLGPTICDEFYFPYARKIWGREPGELSAIQARRRVSAGSFTKLMKKVLSAVPGFKPPGQGVFHYPRRGFGQISEAYAAAATSAGAKLLMKHRVSELCYDDARAKPWSVRATGPSGDVVLDADYVWSTIPISLLARLVKPAPPAEILEATRRIDYRAMLLVYLTLDVQRFTEYDAHYFPGADVAITRLSEPKNYAALDEPRGRTTLCAELPCGTGDEAWSMDDAALGELVAADLARAGIPLPVKPSLVTVRRLSHAYPIYLRGYEEPFGALDAWVETVPRLLSYGRQGLFAHDNTHHALYMAYAAAECMVDGEFDAGRWASYREIFATHVVED